MKIKAAVCSKKGIRALNEDSFILQNHINECGKDKTIYSLELDNPNTTFFAVADGMGGHSSGEKASNFVAKKIIELQTEANQNDFIFDDSSISEKIQHIHSELLAYANENNTPSMGTTLTGLIIQKGKKGIFNVGDSRVYRLRGGFLQQLTRDDSLQNIIKTAASNIITNAIGAGLNDIEVTSRFSEALAVPDDLFLICSDGVHGHFEQEALETFLLKQTDVDIQKTVEELVDIALQNGSDDNCTAMLVKITGE